MILEVIDVDRKADVARAGDHRVEKVISLDPGSVFAERASAFSESRDVCRGFAAFGEG